MKNSPFLFLDMSSTSLSASPSSTTCGSLLSLVESVALDALCSGEHVEHLKPSCTKPQPGESERPCECLRAGE